MTVVSNQEPILDWDGVAFLKKHERQDSFTGFFVPVFKEMMGNIIDCL